ncbi:MAG TPA: cytochrome c biogenesis protein CcsA [Planctomycetota bacterium]|nr:cytochrome c biogenesis protein CcsA [Planctomycetota bacterium]
MTSSTRPFVPAFAALLALLALEAAASAQQGSMPRRSAPWSERTLTLAESLPVQDGGRVKPLSTFADFTLLRFNGKRSMATPDGEELAALPWLLDVLFHPEQAADYAVFKVDDIQAVEAAGIDVAGKQKRDRYSFNELAPGFRRLFELAGEYHRKEEKQRTPVEQQVLQLATNLDAYFALQTHFDYARHSQLVSDTPELVALFGRDDASFSAVVAKMPELLELQFAWAADPARETELDSLLRLLQGASDLSAGTETLALIPPHGSAQDEPAWRTPSDLIAHAIQRDGVAEHSVETLAGFETLARSIGDPAAFERALAALQTRTVAAAEARGEYDKVGLELSYYKLGLIRNSLAVYVLGFVLSALLWLVPRNKLLYRAVATCAVAATALLVAAIVFRCVIRGRPPVSTLYETLLFVTAVGSIILLVTEWIGRQRIALSVNAALGMVGLFLANGYETLDKQDTMPQLVAVLDTNFWLATHVTAITVGYAAGMVAAAIGSVYLLTRLFGIKRNEPAFGKSLIRMTYGALGFGLIFSVVGTILGGIWANDSWGRFWGWDPKENGALLICLTQIAILHGRLGGYLRDFGIAAASAFLGTVVAFSWFGVNLLGVGLHSYGFTSGIHTALWSYYLGQWGLIAVCLAQYGLQRVRERAVREALAERGAGHGGRGGGEVVPSVRDHAE